MDDLYTLSTYLKLKAMNKSNFNLYDYIYYEFSNSKTNPDIFYAIYELFWPTFIVHKGNVLLKETFNESYFQELETTHQPIEYWMNLVTIDPYFVNSDEPYIKSKLFSKKLSKLWKAKLNIDFPEKEFIVDCLYNENSGDVAITFYCTHATHQRYGATD